MKRTMDRVKDIDGMGHIRELSLELWVKRNVEIQMMHSILPWVFICRD